MDAQKKHRQAHTNFIPTDGHIDREGGRTKTERDLDCIRKSIMSGFVFQFQKKMNAFKLLQNTNLFCQQER